jgi:hypothetical protein
LAIGLISSLLHTIWSCLFDDSSVLYPSTPTHHVQVQSGAGRTGKWWGHQQFDGMDPDMVIFAKGIASGYPMAGARQELGDVIADIHTYILYYHF